MLHLPRAQGKSYWTHFHIAMEVVNEKGIIVLLVNDDKLVTPSYKRLKHTLSGLGLKLLRITNEIHISRQTIIVIATFKQYAKIMRKLR